jgi:hypothetical protein
MITTPNSLMSGSMEMPPDINQIETDMVNITNMIPDTIASSYNGISLN